MDSSNVSAFKVWVGIVDGRLVEPYLLPLRLADHTYLIFLQEVSGELLEDVSLYIHRRLWFQHDDAPPHLAGAVRDHLKRCFGQRWIRRGGPIIWPPQSPDLTPLGFFLWGHMSLWCIRPLWILEDLLARVLGAVQEIQQTPGEMERVHHNMSRRYNERNKLGGRHVEPLFSG